MSSGSLPRQLNISGISARDGAQSFTGINLGSIHFADAEDRQRTFEKKVSACLNALFLTDHETDRENLISIKGKRVASTCEWVRDNATYQSWLEGGAHLLWISGSPGKGKTMLSIFLTEELERISKEAKDAELLFYFCSHQDEKRNTAVAVLRGLVHQIVTKRRKLAKHVLPYFETQEKAQLTLSSPETLWIIFRKLVRDPDLGTVFCVLDGLDECDQDAVRLLVPKIIDLFSPETPQPTDKAFKLVIVSRDIPGLHSCARVKLDPDNDGLVANDIERFISIRVQELLRIEGFKELRATVQKALLERSEGTFLWVGFVMNELSQKMTCSEVLEALWALPSGLPAIYSRMLLQIDPNRRRTSSLILHWVTMAVRPLTLEELAAAIGTQSSALITAEHAVRDHIALCGPFLKVQGHEVSLVHQSTRDYLLREETDSNLVLEEYRIKPEEAHLELARICIDCIEHSITQHALPGVNNGSWAGKSPLLKYAVLHWPEHARYSSTLAAELFDPQKSFFQKESILRKNWWETYLRIERMRSEPALPLLHIACQFGIAPWVQALLSKKSWIPRFRKFANKEANEEANGQRPLNLAASRGYEAIVLLLLDHGADANAKNDNGWTALHSAASGGHEAVVRLLLDRGADVNADYGWMALHSAASEGHEAVVRLLLNHGADVNVKEDDGGTALHSAASGGHKAVVRLLLDCGADVNADGYRGTALHSAALEGHEAVVRLLLDCGVDVNAREGDGLTALHWAVSEGHEAVVRLLLDCGADVNAGDGYRGTALSSAVSYYSASKERKALVQLLLDCGADVNAKNNDGWTALCSAASRGHEAVVRLLLDRGADVNAKNNDGKTALHWAALRGHEVVVRLLKLTGASS